MWALYYLNYIPRKQYSRADFGIEAYVSHCDKDGDGVCTDVVAFALRDAGYDLMELAGRPGEDCRVSRKQTELVRNIQDAKYK